MWKHRDSMDRLCKVRIVEWCLVLIYMYFIVTFTFMAAINFSPHGSVTMPSFGMKSQMAGLD